MGDSWRTRLAISSSMLQILYEEGTGTDISKLLECKLLDNHFDESTITSFLVEYLNQWKMWQSLESEDVRRNLLNWQIYRNEMIEGMARSAIYRHNEKLFGLPIYIFDKPKTLCTICIMAHINLLATPLFLLYPIQMGNFWEHPPPLLYYNPFKYKFKQKRAQMVTFDYTNEAIRFRVYNTL